MSEIQKPQFEELKRLNKELFNAARNGDAAKVKNIIKRGANLNGRMSLALLLPLRLQNTDMQMSLKL